MKQTLETQPLIRELKKIIEGITRDLRNSFAKCIKAGEILIKIKASTKYGDWDGVLQAVGVTFKTAKKYMTVWERRSELNLNEIKSLSDAENVFARIGGLPIPTSQNEVVTHEKIASKPSLTLPVTVAPKAIGPCAEFGDGTYRGLTTSDFYSGSRIDIDPADKISKSTPGDVAAAHEVSEVYPKKITLLLLNRCEEDSYGVWLQGIIVKRGNKNGHKKIDMHEAIRSVCAAYKKTTGKTLAVKPADAGQLRRHLESGITLEEFLEVGEKAWTSNGFFARQSHQLAIFVKHYGNIRNELETPTKYDDRDGSLLDRQSEEAIRKANRVIQSL